MKTLTEYLTESKNIKDPKLKKSAYDMSGNEWIIDATCYADGGAPEGCKSLQDLLREFDTTGAMRSELDNLGPDTFIVGAHMASDKNEVAAWTWGYEGICFENK